MEIIVQPLTDTKQSPLFSFISENILDYKQIDSILFRNEQYFRYIVTTEKDAKP